MKLIAGLGNPERKYIGTRHNIGFAVLAELGRLYGNDRARKQFHGEVMEAAISGEKVLLLSPLTYMNRSGTSVQEARDFYKLGTDELLVICDDFNLPLGKLRLRTRGSAGGQKGLEDIIRRLATDEFCRLRIGVGPLPPSWTATSWVLSKFAAEDLPTVDEAIKRAASAAAVWVSGGSQAAMNQYN
jgi:PTH1 family peptidyl-tRNA hydrolase